MILLLITVIEFSRLWNIQATLTDAAGIAARYAGIHHDEPTVIADAIDEVDDIPGFVEWSAATIVVTADCAGAGAATSSITVSPGSVFDWFSTALGSPIEFNATGNMPCG